MNLTKAEMEDIWHNKPVGYWGSYKKKLKKLKKYDCHVQAFKWVDSGQETYVIQAESKYYAEIDALKQFKNKHNLEKDYSMQYRFITRELK